MNNTARKIQTEPTVDVVMVTPKTAKQWLKNNTRNRRLNNTTVDRFANEMKAGAWRLNGETVKFDNFGTLLDGQHRLHAVIKYGHPIRFHVVYNLPAEDDLFTTIDTGTPRSNASALGLAGVKNASTVASSIAFMKATTGGDNGYINAKVSNSEVLDRYRRNPGKWDEIAKIVNDNALRGFLRKPALGFFLWQAMDVDKEAALQFVDMLKTGANLTEKHPVLTLRNALFAPTHETNNKLIRFNQYSKVCRAWNAWRSGKTLGYFKNSDHPMHTPIKLH